MNNEHEEDDMITVITQVGTSNLNQDAKKHVINQYINNQNGEEDGILDKIFGKKNPEKYIALVIALIIGIIGLVCTIIFRSDKVFVKEMWQLFVPALTLVVGYLLGKN